jgi:hypothetical protein
MALLTLRAISITLLVLASAILIQNLDKLIVEEERNDESTTYLPPEVLSWEVLLCYFLSPYWYTV